MSNPILMFLAFLYGQATWLRNCLYDLGVFKSYAVDLPVICVGNLSVGGNGKTPLCITIAKELKQRGFSPVVLMRGYRGNYRGILDVSQTTTSRDAGEEACLIFRKAKVPVVVSKDRLAGARHIVEKALGNVIILDDGFQHRRLQRTINIISVNASTEKAINDFYRMELLPLGKFRENAVQALKRVDFLVFSARSPNSASSIPAQHIIKQRLGLHSKFKLYYSYIDAVGVFALNGEQLLSAQEVIAFSGIANAEGFQQTLRSLGFSIKKEIEFPDHHIFKKADIERILEQYPDIALVCTEKDAIKLRELSIFVRQIYYLKVNTIIDRELQFFDELVSHLTCEAAQSLGVQTPNL